MVDGVVQEEKVDTMVVVREVEKRVVAKKEVSMEVLKVAGVMTVEMVARKGGYVVSGVKEKGAWSEDTL